MELWVIEYRPDRPDRVPQHSDWPDLEEQGIEVIVADLLFQVVHADLETLQAILKDYPYVQITGHPRSGRFLGAGGEEVYIVNGKVIDDEWEAWEQLGLTPQKFGADSWYDVNRSDVLEQIPTY